MTPETLIMAGVVVGILTGLLGCVGSLGAGVYVFVVIGRRDQVLSDLATRHGELAKECRERLAAHEHRAGTLGEGVAKLEVKLEELKAGMSRVEMMLAKSRGAR